MRAISVVGASLALVGCCLFVMHSENASLSFESTKLSEDDSAASRWSLPKSLKEAAKKAGDAARSPVLHVSPTIGAGSEHTVVEEKKHDAVEGQNPEKWVKPVGRLQANCLALKAYAYTVQDTVIDDGFKDLGVTYDLLRAMTPTGKATRANMTPKDCVKQLKAFVEAMKEEYPLKDSIPHMEVRAIEHNMKRKGILLNTKMGNKKVLTVDAVKVGLGKHKVIAEMKGMAPMKGEVMHTLSGMEGTYDAAVAGSMGAEVQDAPHLDTADGEALVRWDGDFAAA